MTEIKLPSSNPVIAELARVDIGFLSGFTGWLDIQDVGFKVEGLGSSSWTLLVGPF